LYKQTDSINNEREIAHTNKREEKNPGRARRITREIEKQRKYRNGDFVGFFERTTSDERRI